MSSHLGVTIVVAIIVCVPGQAFPKRVGGQSIDISGIQTLNAPLSADVDVLHFSENSLLYTNGFPVLIKAKKLLIDSQASIRGLQDVDINACANSTLPKPGKTASGYSWNPGPNSEGPGPGNNGRMGGKGTIGRGGLVWLTRSNVCVPKSVGSVRIEISDSADGFLDVFLPGARGVQVEPAGDGGNGGTGEQGGRCPPGIRGQNGGVGGTGGTGGFAFLASAANTSGNGGDLSIIVHGDASNFSLGTVDLSAGSPSLPGEVGNGGNGGDGGFFGRGGAGCVGAEKVRAFSGTPGAKGLAWMQSVGSLGADGKLNLSGVDWQTDACTAPPSMDENQVWSATKEFWTGLAPIVFGQNVESVEIPNSNRPALVIPGVSLQKLLKLSQYSLNFDSEVFQLVQTLPAIPNPSSNCNSEDLSCCETTLSNGTKISAPYLGCLTQFKPGSDWTGFISRVSFLLLLNRVVAQEVARRAFLVNVVDNPVSVLRGGAIYAKIAGPGAGAQWPGEKYLYVKFDTSLFDAVAYILQKSSNALAVALLEAPFRLDERQEGYAVHCADGRPRLIDIRNSEIVDLQSFSKLRASSGKTVDIVTPNAQNLPPDDIAVEMYTYRDITMLRARNGLFSSSDGKDVCQVASDANIRGDKLLNCSASAASNNTLNLLQDKLAVPDLQGTYFDLNYISAFVGAVSANAPQLSEKSKKFIPGSVRTIFSSGEGK